VLCRNPELLVEARQEAVQDFIGLVDGGDARQAQLGEALQYA
jgi:hypothetical protein